MERIDICCIGHITLDKVVTPRSAVFMAGGTAFYFSNALSRMDVRYRLVTAVASDGMAAVSSGMVNGLSGRRSLPPFPR